MSAISSPADTRPSMKIARQSHFAFGPPALRREAFVASEENAAARLALDNWRNWPGGAFALYGEAGSGKSHLAAIWAEAAGAAIISGSDLDCGLGERPPHLCVDDADRAPDDALYALLTLTERTGGAVLLVARDPPAVWPAQLPDLKSRLAALALDRVRPPEPPLLAELVTRHAAARGYRLTPAAALYVAERMPRACSAAAAMADALCDAGGPGVRSPMELARRALRALGFGDAEDTPDGEPGAMR